MNEATLEGNLNATLDRLFRGPLRPKIEHQRILTLRFGHHSATVDGVADSEARGRLDVLLKSEQLHLAVLELKRKGLPLTGDDETQAWSYARLLNPMPPLYIVTNGEETRFFRTYDRQHLNLHSLEEKTLAAQISAAAGAAASETTIAIRFLLGRSPEVFRQLFRGVTQAELTLITGPVDNLRQPLATGFRVPRLATVQLQQRILEKRSAIALVGLPLCGKTNVIAELCDESEHGPPSAQQIVPLYVNCSQRPQGVFQSLATGLTKQTGVPATAEDVRIWLTSGCLATEQDRPVIILDCWPARFREKWEGELAELLDLAGESTFTLVVVLDEVQAEAMLVNPARGQFSRLGSMAERMRVESLLGHKELAVAEYILANYNKLRFEPGAEHNIFYRFPYTWRLLASQRQMAGLVPAVLGTEYIHAARQVLEPSPQHIQLLRQYAQAVVDEKADGQVEEILLGSPGWATWETAVRFVGESGLAQLQEAGFIRARNGPRDRILVSMQIPALLASVGANLLTERLKSALETSPHEVVVNTLILQCQRFPFGALVGAAAILSLEPPALITAMVDRMLARQPMIGRVRKDMRLALPIEGRRMLNVPPEFVRQSLANGGGNLYGDSFPYLVLSYMMSSLDLTSTGGRDLFERLLDHVAGVAMPLLAVDAASGERLQGALPLSVHDFPRGGSVLDSSNGIIEPITDAVRRAVLEHPEAIEAYIQKLLTLEAPPFPLLYRVWMAAAFVAKLAVPAAAAAEHWAAALSKRIEEQLTVEFRPTATGLDATDHQQSKKDPTPKERADQRKKERKKAKRREKRSRSG